MSKQNIANCLKQLRKTSAYSANEIVEMLTEYDINISAKTLYGYESGLSMPNADVFVALCRIYKCDNPMDIFGGISLSSPEVALIEKYRSLDQVGRKHVDTVIQWESDRVEQIASLESQINSESFVLLNAAHEDPAGATPEQKQHADDIMADDSEWE
ncbi:MAG: hypothetical protein LUI87_02085 [Lachnospiraceae bacterium]|nr:hypothetical protein [Lachnospiraceae bacterium]